MTSKQFLAISKNTNYENMNRIIENSDLTLELADSKPYYKSWKVIGNKEIYRITNYLKDHESNMSDVKFGFNY